VRIKKYLRILEMAAEYFSNHVSLYPDTVPLTIIEKYFMTY